MLHSRTKYYMKSAISNTPATISILIKDATTSDYDRRPDPDRFTIREVMGHLADWDGVWLERMSRIRDEENPFLPGYDEGQWAIDNNYSGMDVDEQLERLKEGHRKIVNLLEGLSEEDWERTGTHGELGTISIADLTTIVLAHDGHHSRQIIEWIAAGEGETD